MINTIPALPAAPVLDMPQFFIKDKERVYTLEAAPVETFDAWVQAIIAAEQLDDPLAFFIIKRHSETWDDLARLWLTIDFQMRGIDLQRYAYTSRELAEQAVRA